MTTDRTGGGRLGIRGDLGETPLPDILQLLAQGRKTGRLSATGVDNTGWIFLVDGIVAHAAVADRSVSVGDLLVREGKVTPQQLAAATQQRQWDPQHRLDQLLAGSGAVSQDDIMRSVHGEVCEAVYQLFLWTEGTFFFEPDQRLSPDLVPVSLDVERLLLDAARRADERGRIQDPRRAGDAGSAGRADHTAARHRSLAATFYRMGRWEEALREWAEVSSLEPDALDVTFHRGLIGLWRGDPVAALESFQRLLNAAVPNAAVLADGALALEMAGRTTEALRASEEALKHAPDEPRLLLSHGILLYKLRALGQAREVFRRYRSALEGGARPAAAYFVFAMLTEAGLGDLEAAHRLGEGGLAIYPFSPPLLMHVGALWEGQGNTKGAKLLYGRALDRDGAPSETRDALADPRTDRSAEGETGYPGDDQSEGSSYTLHEWQAWFGLNERVIEEMGGVR